MQDILRDIIKYGGCAGLIETIQITGSDEETKITASDEEKTLFVDGVLHDPQTDLNGKFGITNLKLLNGLLNFSSYNTPTSSFSVKRFVRNGQEVPEQFEFKDSNGKGSSFRLVGPDTLPAQAVIKDIPWNVEFYPSPPSISEFTQLAQLYSEIDRYFGIKTVDGDLCFYVGDSNSSMHKADMVFESNVEGELNSEVSFPIDKFLNVMRLANGAETKIKITQHGVLGIDINTKHAHYTYYLRARR